MTDKAINMQQNELAVEFENVHMIFPGKLKRPVYALQGMNLAVPSGSIVGLLGPNGSGKTTAVACLIGLLYPQMGQLRLWGRQASETGPNRIGVVLEDTRLPPFLSVKSALLATCALRELSEKQAGAELERIVQISGIEPLLDLRINGLSKGQARRVGVASALIGDPPLLVMDEPASGLDISARIEFNTLIRELKDGKRTILITSHLLGDVENTCSHIAIMQTGCIRIFDETQHLLPSNDDETDIYIHQNHIRELDCLKLFYDASRYPQLVKLRSTAMPTYQLLGILAERSIAPTRMEPRTNLISYYLSVTNNEA
jgi:ABC-type multidrug transport system ATPase subunit